MYLKSLEIIGFKSFASKTVLNFDRGVTVIVGPNGCGKSNVLDSVRWVLGEQSAKALRGGEMADVIFSGTDSRPGLGMAEVSMIFADCEKDLGVAWNEVTITRRVYRDGQGEYFLNKTPCRLRDIHQLFMDTGVGRSAYSIMEQGKIDQILSSRPEDRRAIFEEAAGITKFKAQRREALRKLEATEANLLRLTDVIREVKRQIGSLQRQAAKARRYQTLIADLRTLDTHFCQHLYQDLETQRTEVEEKSHQLHSNQELRERDVQEQETAVAEARRELELLEERLVMARQGVNELQNRITQGESRIGFNNERLAEFQALNERHEQDITASEARLCQQQEQIEQADHELGTIQEGIGAQEAQLQERLSTAGDLTAQRVETERQQQAIFTQINQLETRLSGLRAEVAACINTRDGSQARLAIMGEEIEKLRYAGEALEIQQAEVNEQTETTLASIETRKADVAEADTVVRTTQAELSLLDKELHTESRRMSERESKLEVLRQLNADGAGFSEGAQAVLKGLDNAAFYKPAVLGALAQFIEVGASHIVAIEAALGQNLQAIVMKDTLVAEAVIKALTEKKLGRASLALRPLWNAAAVTATSPLPAGALGWALDKVTCQPEVAPLLGQLLAGVVLVEDLACGLRLAAEVGGSRYQFVTLSGEIVTREGIAIGGQAKEEGGISILQRKAQIAELEAETDRIRTALAGLTQRRQDAADRLEAAQSRLQEARDESQTLSLTLAHLRGRIDTLTREAAETRRKQETFGAERDAIEQRNEAAIAQLARLEEDEHVATADIAALQAQQSEMQNCLAGLRESETMFSSELNELRVRVATEKQRIASLQNQRGPMTSRVAELRELIEARRRDIEAYTARTAQLAEDSENLTAGIAQAQSHLGEATEAVQTLLAERTAIAIQVETLENTLRQARFDLTHCHETHTQLEVRASQLALRIEALAERVLHRYQLDIRDFQSDSYAFFTTVRELKKRQKSSAPGDEEAEPPVAAETDDETKPAEAPADDGPDWDLVESLIKELDAKVEAMGPVNVEAIQEYDELEERYKFLEQQNSDLDTSKTELLEVIAKINHTTKTLFADTFEQVRINFKEMFGELFGGGKANLVLLDESDPLESGIDIIAKPPGKQLTSITLLSGGEKTMTAVALLFSIYMVKPSPFCILDEMDAPLDESNINRFIKILDRFVSQSQFVVISHNKRTIAKGDIIYGVTMEEHGVSKLVSVKFTQREGSAEGNDIMGTENAVPSVAESFGKSGDLHSEQMAAAEEAGSPV